jgi:hypothetical protein
LHIPTEAGLRALVDRANMRILESFYDSTDFGFWGSELYKRDVPLTYEHPPVFSKEQIEEWRRLAEQLNARHDGDHATFVLGQ